MRAGKLNKIVTFQEKVALSDSFGGTVFEWLDVAAVWAAVYPLKGRELIAAQAAQQETTTRFVVRYRDDIGQDNRISYNGKYYNIESVIDPEKAHEQLHIMASTGLSEG